MFAADQQKLAQDVNQQVLGIRQSELDYLVSVKKQYGIRASLLGVFTFKIYTLAQHNDSAYAERCSTLYYVFTGLTIAAAVHIILLAFFLQTMGPGLALNGPVGSVVRAINVLYSEVWHVHLSFVFLIICFWFTTVFAFWAIMDFTAACVNTFLFVIAVPISFHYLLKAYSRFGWSPLDPKQRVHFKEFLRDESNMMPSVAVQALAKEQAMYEEYEKNNSEENQENDKVFPVIGWFFSSQNRKNSSNHQSENGKGSYIPPKWEETTVTTSSKSVTSSNPVKGVATATSTKSSGGVTEEDWNRVIMEGYMTKQAMDPGVFASVKWDRRYFILNARGLILYYKSRPDYRSNPDEPIKERPLQIDDYKISMESNPTSENGGPFFQLTLKPKDDTLRIWYFRTDTEEELRLWMDSLIELSPQSFEDL